MKFDFVDRIYSFEKYKDIKGSKLISLEEYFLLRPHGLRRTFPGMLMIESVFQLGNWLIFLSSDFTKLGFIIMFQQMDIIRHPVGGDKLDMEVSIERFQDDKILMNGFAYIDGEKVFEGKRCFVHLEPLENYLNPENVKVKFSEIYRGNQ